MDYYEILQVSRQAEIEVIDAAYKRLSLKYHPDKNSSPDANEKMQHINQAYQVLKNPDSRRQYDSYLESSNNSRSDRNVSVQNHGLETFWGVVGEVLVGANELFGEKCPYCGTKSWVHQEKKSKSPWDWVVGQERIKCFKCGNTFKVS